jgi:hypothetical protein
MLSFLSNQKFRFILLSSLSVLFLIIGYIEYTYILNLSVTDLPLFVYRNTYSQGNYSLKAILENQDPRLYSMLIYSLIAILFSSLISVVFMSSKKYFKTTIAIYLFLYTLVLVIGSLFYLFGLPKIGLSILMETKNGLSSPFATCFLLVIYKVSVKS